MAVSVALTLGLAACSQPPVADVVAADGVLCDITRRLAATDLRVHCLLAAGDDPHQLQLSPRQGRAIREGRLLLINGYGLTPALERLPGAVPVAELAVPASPELNDAHHGHPQGAGTSNRDPHVWHDPRQAAAMLKLVSEKLERLNPAAADRIRHRANALQASLTDLHGWNQRQFSTLPAPRILASSHRGFASLARAYALEELALLDAGSNSATLRPQQLTTTLQELRRHRVKALFAEQLPASPALKRISALSGVPIAGSALRADGLAPGHHGGANSLMATLTTNTCLLTDQLGGRCDRRSQARLIDAWEAVR